LREAWLDVSPSGNPKIYVGALGGKSALEVAGKYGDGWISWLNSPETFKKKLEIVNPGAREFEACVWVYMVITENPSEIKKAANRAKRGLLAEKSTLEMMGFKRPEGLGKSFQNMLVTPGGSKKFQDAQDSVPDELALSCIAAGPPSEIVKKILEFERAGATRALIHFVGDDPAQIELFATKVLPKFQSRV
jgi:alkanesulfonate monooxygenase SsuD/methylene tetrahydromethanopterin reductase-like flavin-dependent oxidoreductase (luciferase family)